MPGFFLFPKENLSGCPSPPGLPAPLVSVFHKLPAMAFSCWFLPLEWPTRSCFLHVITCKVLLWHCWKVWELWCETKVAGTEKLEMGENSDMRPAQLMQGSGTKGRSWIWSVESSCDTFFPNKQLWLVTQVTSVAFCLFTWAHLKKNSLLLLLGAVGILNFYVWKCFCIDNVLKGVFFAMLEAFFCCDFLFLELWVCRFMD